MPSSEPASGRRRKERPAVDPLPPGRPEDDLLTTAQVAQMLHLSLRTVFKLVEDGTLPARRLPGTRKLLFKRGEILAIVDANVLKPGDIAVEDAARSISDAE